MRIAMKNPAEVGADRIVNAVAAFEKYGGPCIVADYGTATTFDVISAEGDYLGGVIAPGIEVSLEALTTRAAKLIKVELRRTRARHRQVDHRGAAVGRRLRLRRRDRGHRARHLGRARRATPRSIATGGLAEMIARHTDVIDAVDPLLTLRGIEIVMRRQQRA